MTIYADNIIHHYKHPVGKPLLDEFDIKHEEVNHACSDAITVSLKIKDNTVEAIGWEGLGCAISQAAMSILLEELINMKLEDVLKLNRDDVTELLGVPISERRLKCALLGLHVVKNALYKFQNEEPKIWLENVGTS